VSQFEQTHTTILPHFAYPMSYHWRSVSFAAKFYGRTERRIRQWIVQGRFASLNIPVYQDKSGRWWIAINEENT
jgi:hypothetical protein